MPDLIVVSLESWDQVWRRNQHLVAGLLSRDPAFRVLFVEPPADPTHDLRSKRPPRFGAGMALDEHTRLGGSRSGFAGIEVPVGYLFAENGARSLSVGATLRFFFTVF